jgi:hypothetical protein
MLGNRGWAISVVTLRIENEGRSAQQRPEVLDAAPAQHDIYVTAPIVGGELVPFCSGDQGNEKSVCNRAAGNGHGRNRLRRNEEARYATGAAGEPQH